MNILKKILVLLILITSVINQCLLPVKTGNWSLLTPVVFCNRKISDENETIFNNVYVRKEGCLNTLDDIERAIDMLNNKLFSLSKFTPFFVNYADFAVVMTNATFTNDYFYDHQTKRFYVWDSSLDFLSTYYKAEAEESVLNGSTTQFITFKTENAVDFSLQLVESKNDLWTTNEPFLFLSNSSKFCSQDDKNIDIFKTFLKKAQPLPCETVIKTDTSEIITILVIIMVIITAATIVFTYVLKKICSRKRKQHIRESSLVYKKRKNEKAESGYEEAVEVHEYAEAGNANRIFYDIQGNRVNQILKSEEQLEYDYAYSTFKPLKSLSTKENSGNVNYDRLDTLKNM